MTNNKYTRARDVAFALNRFVKRSARPRRGERKSHFEKDCRTARLLSTDPNVLGFGVGHKITQGERDALEVCLVFFVRKKLPTSRLRDVVEIPKHLYVDTVGLKVRTDVQEWGGPPIAHGYLSSGASVGDLAGNSGTMTLAVQDRSTGIGLILSCSHVLAACGNANVGDEIESPANPRADPGSNTVGQLLRFTKIDPGSLTNAVDAAVASVLQGVDLSNNIPGIGTIAGIRDLTLEGEAVINQVDVQRVGAVTGVQAGTIRNIHVSTRITYHQLPGDPSVYFVDLVQYDALSEEGDSGGLVVDTNDARNAVGMHIAGMQDGSASLFTHIQYVFDKMRVSFQSFSL
jgi:hypothetical protein